MFEELQKYDSGPNRYRPWGGPWGVRFKRSYRYPWEMDRYEHFEDAGMVSTEQTSYQFGYTMKDSFAKIKISSF